MTGGTTLQNITITPIAKVLETLVKAKYNIFISGGTGSGNNISYHCLIIFPKNERVITIEDSG